MKIFISNLNFKTTAVHLSNLFLQFGIVLSAKIIMDNTGHSLGYGYIVMDQQSGNSAINVLNNINFMNHYIEVSEAVV
ncbi:RNA recognition motif domain-containing protein [Longitalea luteola]|uniref:RNA recognition motif domain-containing protein n=1 Tax=Longitalea luteola TaxID=2812563 RepID=UPI001A969180|nr:RNA-binding protein [Longitalea luteola]